MPLPPQRIDRLRLRHLRLLELIKQHGSLRAIGAVLNVTQPAVSQMVKDLELSLGAKLIERSASGVALNPSGVHALERIRAGLATFDNLTSELVAERPMLIRIGTNPAVMYQFLPDAIYRLEPSRTNQRISIRSGKVDDMISALQDGELDCYIGRVNWGKLPIRQANVLRSTPLFQSDLVFACPRYHPLASQPTLLMKDICDWPLVLAPTETNNRIELESGYRNRGLAPPLPIIEIAGGPDSLVTMAKKLGALTCIPKIALESEIAAGQMLQLNVTDMNLPRIQISFVTLVEKDSFPPLQALQQAVLDEAANWRTMQDEATG